MPEWPVAGRSPGAAAWAAWLICWLISSACGPDHAPRAEPDATGVSGDTIRIGSSLALSGHAASLGIQTLAGAQAYLRYINENGGVHGRRIRLITYDDAYDPTRCLANTQRLLVEDQVFALSCYVGTPTTVKIVPLLEQARVPLVGMFTGANALREPFHRYLVNVRPSYYQETRAAVDHMVRDLGLTRIAVFYQYDAYGFDGLTGVELALRAHGLAPVARSSYVRGTADVADGLARIAASQAQAVVMIGTYQSCSAFILEALEREYAPVFYAVSFVGADELASRLEERLGGNPLVLMSQVVPPPGQTRAGQTNVGQRGGDFAALLAAYAPGLRPNFVSYEGFLNAKVLVEALHRAGPQLNRESFLDAVASMRAYPLGAAEDKDLVVRFGPKDHQGLDTVYFTRLGPRGFTLFTDWAPIRKELAGPVPAGSW